MRAPTRPWGGGGFEAAVSELVEVDAAAAAAARTEAARIRRLIELTDEMVGRLERDNLAGLDRVRREWRPKLAYLCVSVEPKLLGRLRRVHTPSEALDLIFDLQERLLERKRTPHPRVDARRRSTCSPANVVWPRRSGERV